MAVSTVGNQDFRGYLNALAKQGDGRAQLAISGYNGLGYVDNSGNINVNLLRELNQAAPGAGTSDEQLQNDQISYLQNAWNTYKGATSGGGSGGGSAGTAQDKADEMAYWQDQMNNADQQLARIPIQEQVGNQNIDNSYNSAYNRLVGDKETTNRDYTTKRSQTIEDNTTAKAGINESVRNQNTALQRLLGGKGAGGSSAATILAPFAAASQGNKQRQQVQTTFGRNLSGLDTSWGDYQKDWDTSAGDLAAQRDAERNKLKSGLAQTEASIQEEKANAAVQRQQAGGASYQSARNARTPYISRIQSLIQQIDALGNTPTFTPQAVAYKAPDMASYTYDRYAAPSVGSSVDPNLAQGAGAYWTLLQGEDKKKQTVI